MIILNSLFPVFFLIALGVSLKRVGFTDSSFLHQSDKLVYSVFFPVMLFYKIGSASFSNGVDWRFCGITLLVVTGMFILSVLVIRLFPVGSFQAGAFSQSCYRFNTYIGVAVILYCLGEQGVAVFGVLIGLAIPLINVFAVSVLIWYSGSDLAFGGRVKMLWRTLCANPLILGCIAGIVWSRLVGVFPVFIDNTLKLLSMVTLPMALISVGGALTFDGVRVHLRNSLAAAFLKLVVLPLTGYWAFRLAGIDGLEFRVGMIFFCLPASTAIYVLSSQLNSDTELASSSIVLSTLLSFFSLSWALLV